jgi:TolB protein
MGGAGQSSFSGLEARVSSRLTGGGHMDILPVYSPDGSKILYMSDRLSPGSFDTFVMDPDGSHKRRLIAGAFGPNWGTKHVE